MLVALFPDEVTVLLVQRAEPEGGAAGCDAAYRIPSADELIKVGIHIPENPWVFVERDGDQVSGAIRGTGVRAAEGRPLPDGGVLVAVGRREASVLLDIDDYWAVNRAFHLAYWDQATRFCGTCAGPMERKSGEIAKTCTACGRSVYPRIAPAVIVAVVRDGTLLMGHSHRSRGRMFSVLAGFAEAGETLEHTVAREVFEESGVVVRNVRYFSSQPWPFPDSLMIAFTAEYATGELTPQESEILELKWVSPSELPEEIPGRYSIARRLIEWFVSEYGTEEDLRALLERERT